MAMSVCCHTIVQFSLHESERDAWSVIPGGSGKPDILQIKIAHYRLRENLQYMPSVACDTCCQISWIDASGKPTPDANPMVGYVYREAYSERMPNGHSYQFPQTPYFCICSVHKERLATLPHWRFVEKL
jgi:hypothetical protein